MEIEKQVCDLEQAKRLKELGVKQESYLYWRQEKAYPENPVVLLRKKEFPGPIDIDAFNIYSAYTVAELGVMLWDKYNILRYVKKYEGSFDGKNFGFNAFSYFNKSVIIYECFYTEAQARATLLIYLLENKIITAKEVNKNL